jgi:hypothetical protein
MGPFHQILRAELPETVAILIYCPDCTGVRTNAEPEEVLMEDTLIPWTTNCFPAGRFSVLVTPLRKNPHALFVGAISPLTILVEISSPLT